MGLRGDNEYGTGNEYSQGRACWQLRAEGRQFTNHRMTGGSETQWKNLKKRRKCSFKSLTEKA